MLQDQNWKTGALKPTWTGCFKRQGLKGRKAKVTSASIHSIIIAHRCSWQRNSEADTLQTQLCFVWRREGNLALHLKHLWHKGIEGAYIILNNVRNVETTEQFYPRKFSFMNTETQTRLHLSFRQHSIRKYTKLHKVGNVRKQSHKETSGWLRLTDLSWEWFRNKNGV